MLTSLHTRLKNASRWLPVALLPFAANAQINYAGGNAVNTTTTYTDLAATGTAIATANTDDDNSAAQSIGFTFSYNGATFTQFVLNTNGFIKLGSVAPSAPALINAIGSADALDVNIIAPSSNVDLQTSATAPAEYRVLTTGTAGARVTTIQWKNVADKLSANAPAQFASMQFQVKLYETSNQIEFVYGTWVAGTGTPTGQPFVVGLKGTTNGIADRLFAAKPSSATAWSTTTFSAGTTAQLLAHFVRNTFPPDAGRTYRFLPGTPCGNPVSPLISATNNSIQLAFTPGTGNVSYNVTYSSGGAVQTLSPAPTTSPITIPGLLPGTTYTVTLQSVCASGTGAVLTGTATTTGTAPAAVYATLPYTESFEGTWINGLSTKDLPTANWRNSPATGDNSWRREDDGFASAAWRFVADETGATPPYVTRFSTGAHSARFHSFGAAAGLQGRLDLYVNLSGTGSKTLSFDYINPTGTDKVDVFVSTDGGATFGTTPVLTATTNTTFTAKTVTLASTSATTVLRFQATSDFGDDDIGIDNLQLRVVTATRNEALAATVSLFPNPAKGVFTLGVPAGRLHAASATLLNALGQVVQSRQLSLSPAGGNVEFNVSGLAAGVYSLQLKTGADLVVKRVVVE